MFQFQIYLAEALFCYRKKMPNSQLYPQRKILFTNLFLKWFTKQKQKIIIYHLACCTKKKNCKFIFCSENQADTKLSSMLKFVSVQNQPTIKKKKCIPFVHCVFWHKGMDFEVFSRFKKNMNISVIMLLWVPNKINQLA